MIIKFKKLHIQNFLSLGNVELDLNDKGFNLIDGINNNQNDNAKSNGSGKSSIFEAIFYILTGETVRGTKDIINKNTSEGMYGELLFSIDNNNYKVIRTREHSQYGTNLKIYLNNEDISGKGIRDSEKILQQYLPDLTAQLLGSVIILGQGLPQRFSNNTPAGRKETLETLAKSDYMIEDIKSKLNNRKTDYNTSLQEEKHTLLKFQTETKICEQTIESRTLSLKSLPDMSILTGEIQSLQAEIVKVTDNITLIEKQVEDSFTRLKTKEEQFTVELAKIEECFQQELKPLNENVANINSEKRVEKYKLDEIIHKIVEADNVQLVCPTCKRPLDNAFKIDTSSMIEEKEKIQKNIELLDTKNNSISKQIQELSQFYKDKKLTLNYLSVEIDDINYQINKLKDNIRNNNYALKDFTTEKQNKERDLSSLNSKKEIWENDIKQSQEKLSLNATLIDGCENKIEYFNIRLDIISKLITTASREFRNYLLESIIQFMNNRVQYYSSRMFNNKAEFKSDGNQIWIGYDNRQYENLSGGEKQKLDIVVQLSLRDMLMQTLNFSSNILVLDEVFDNLDSTGCENLINLINEELKDIESVYIITHHSDIEIPYDEKLTIIKNEYGVSNLI